MITMIRFFEAISLGMDSSKTPPPKPKFKISNGARKFCKNALRPPKAIRRLASTLVQNAVFLAGLLLLILGSFQTASADHLLPRDPFDSTLFYEYNIVELDNITIGCGSVAYMVAEDRGENGRYYLGVHSPESVGRRLIGEREWQSEIVIRDQWLRVIVPEYAAPAGYRILRLNGDFTLSSSNFNTIESGCGQKGFRVWSPEVLQEAEAIWHDANYYVTFDSFAPTEPVVPDTTLVSVDTRFTDRRADARVSADQEFGVSMVVKASDGSGDVTDIALTSNFIRAQNLDLVSEPTIPPSFSLQPGQERSFDWVVKPNAGGEFRIVGKLTAKDGAGRDTGEILDALEGRVLGDELSAEITLDPSSIDETQSEEIGGEPVPIEFKATLKVCNNSTADITKVTIRRFRALPRISTSIFTVTKLEGGPVIDPIVGYLIGTLEKDQCESFDYRYRIDDDVEVEVDTLVDGISASGSNLTVLDEVTLSVKPKYLLGFEANVIRPSNNTQLPAGEVIQIKGTVKNLSNTHTLKLGPLFPELKGNAGHQSLTWDAAGVDPDRFEIPEYPLTLNPREEQDFHVRVVTMFSDPRHSGNPPTNSGARADITFTPWAIVVDADGIESSLERDQIKITDENLTLRVAIDDSHPIPELDYLAIGGGIMYGSAEAAYYFSAGLALGVIELVKLPVTVLWGAMSYQSAVWKSFTEEEKQEFAEDTGFLVASVLLRNAELAKTDIATLASGANNAVYQTMKNMANEWEVGNHADTVRGITRYTGEFVGGEVVMSLAFARLAKNAKAAAALERADSARQAKNVGKLNQTKAAATLERVEDVLQTVDTGVITDASTLEKVMGYLPEESQWIQKTCLEFKILCVSRSRAVESIKWVKKFAAKLKPEALKAKTVSLLDELLGYPKIYSGESSVGAMVFKKPEALVAWETTGGNFGDHIVDWVTSRGIPQDHPQFEAALRRIALRADEWKKYEKVYKQWNDRKYIDTTFNFSGNGVKRETLWKLDPSLRKKGMEKAEQFRMRRLHPEGSPNEAYLMELFDAKAGKWRPITGDIDFLAFTHRDGTSLSNAMHAQVLKAFSKGPIGIRHPESASFLQGGVDFIAKQLKLLEAAVMFGGPEDELGRFVRLDKAKTIWDGPGLYKLNFKGGYKHAGEFIPNDEIGAIEQLANPVASVAAPVQKPRLIPKQSPDGGPNVGRCDIRTTSDPAAPSVALGRNGRLVEAATDGTVQDSTLHDVCFADEPGIVKVQIAPGASILLTDDSSKTGQPVFKRAVAGDTSLSLVADERVVIPGLFGGLEVGQTIAIGLDTDTVELRDIVSLNPITLDTALDFNHEEQAVIVVVKPSARQLMVEADTDADGVLDIEDYFPDDASESGDIDRDGVGDNADTDDDNDGYSDDSELLVFSDPTDPADTPANHQPEQPTITVVTVLNGTEQGISLSYSTSQISDPDGTNTTGTTRVQVFGPGNYGVDTLVYQRTDLPTSGSNGIILPLSTLSSDEIYRLSIAHQDATGLVSDPSIEEVFTAPPALSTDINFNNVDDMYEYLEFSDLDSNGIGDTEEGHIVLTTASTSTTLSIAGTLGYFNNVSVLSQGKAVSNVNGARVSNDFVVFRIDYLDDAEVVDVALVYANDLPAESTLITYDPQSGFSNVSNAAIERNKITVQLTDGASGDLDGVVNGQIVGALGTGVVTDEITAPLSTSGGGGGCTVSSTSKPLDTILLGMLAFSLLGLWSRRTRDPTYKSRA